MGFRRGWVALPIAVLVSAVAVGILAGPPFLTDDPEPVEVGHYEAYVFSTYDQVSDGKELRAPALEFNFGAAPNLQLHVVVPWAWSQVPGGPRRSGWGDVEVGLKFRFVQETESTPQIGIFPMAELPAGNAQRGLGNGQAWFMLPVWIQKSWGPWTTYGGGGWVINHAPGMRDHAYGGWLLQRDMGERLTLGGEVFAQGADTTEGRGTVIANAGGVLNFGPGFSLLFSAGRSVGGEGHTVAYLGLYWTWGPAKVVPKRP
jgi:hypothetical protein